MISLGDNLSEVALEMHYGKATGVFNVESIGKGGKLGRKCQY